jgi:hypothetical protein
MSGGFLRDFDAFEHSLRDLYDFSSHFERISLETVSRA